MWPKKEVEALRGMEICFIPAGHPHPEPVNLCRAAISGTARALVVRACSAGTGLAGLAGTTAAAIKRRPSGVNLRSKEGISPKIEDSWCGGNLRNGSSAGCAYLNCRNRLGRAGWNYGG